MEGILSHLPAAKYPKTGFGYTEETLPQKYLEFSKLPKISIITPSYNQGVYLEETIRSVLAQNYPNLELIIIDGGSKDSTLDVLQLYDKQIAHWVSEKDQGTYDANNKGLSVMTGDYWCVLNSDDTFTADAIYYVVKHINEVVPNEPDWITGGIIAIDQNSAEKARVMPSEPKKVGGRTFAYGCWIYHPCTFLSRKVHKVVGNFHRTDIMDYEYWTRMEALDYFPEVIPQYLAGLRFHPDCKSFNYLKIIKSVRDIVEDQKRRDYDYLKYSQILEYDARLREWDLQYFTLKVKTEIFTKSYLNALRTFFYIAIRFPEQLLKRWYWGAVKRIFTGIKEEEFSPLSFLNQ